MLHWNAVCLWQARLSIPLTSPGAANEMRALPQDVPGEGLAVRRDEYAGRGADFLLAQINRAVAVSVGPVAVTHFQFV